MDHNEKNNFAYNYSAREQAELKKIREKYSSDTKSSELSKMEKIRQLDESVTRKGMAVALVFGIFGALLMGFGMSLIMTDLKEILGTHIGAALAMGIALGLVGMLSVIMAYPLYQYITAKERKRIAPEILRLADELMDGKFLNR